MARKPNKTKSTRRPTIKSKAKRRESKPLLAVVASVRTAKPSTSMSTNGKPPTSPFSPALTGVQMMASMMGTYAALPARLWFEQVRFVQRVFSESTAPADRLSRG